jgi:hypothetical protein
MMSRGWSEGVRAISDIAERVVMYVRLRVQVEISTEGIAPTIENVPRLQIEFRLAGINTILRERGTQVLHRERGSSFVL